MPSRCPFAFAAVVALACLCRVSFALPPGFEITDVLSGWNQPVGIAFAPTIGGPAAGRTFVWEKGGRVWIIENGVKLPTPLIDINEEVGNWRDFGLLGFVVDPNYWTNGYIYLLYTVDYHHLKYFGTPTYNPATNTYNRDTIGRIARYQARADTNYAVVDYASRTVLLGESMSTGFPMCHQSHGVGSLIFGRDGTLIASCGDGASYSVTDTGGPIGGSSNTALADGIISTKEDVGAFRAQLVDSLSGKLVRIDPATGNGVPSNPFYNAASPRAAKSRVWALGARNPYRITLRPGTGSTNPADANPGVIVFGDVGWQTWEDLNVCDGPGQNFGWPLYEGLTSVSSYQNATTVNSDAPNPLAGGSCGNFFKFKDLCIQDTLAPSWPNPCNTAQQIPASIPRFVHKRPVIDWKHGTGPSRTGIYSGNNAATADLGASGSPVAGPQFGGNCATGGFFYQGTNWPAEYQGAYFFGDYGQKWLRYANFNAQHRPTAVFDFAPNDSAGYVVISEHPVSGDLYFIAYSETGDSFVRRISYATSGPNLPPTAVASANPTSGPAPLAVLLTGSESTDPENHQLLYRWDFGDGLPPSFEADSFHFYNREIDITPLGTIVARIFSLTPPTPTGAGNKNPETIRDNDYPPQNSVDSLRQYDTFHNNQQGSDDWIGYTFAQTHTFTALIFQEGRHFPDGGWFDTLTVETTLNGTTWTPVTGLSISPNYPLASNGSTFELYDIRFNPVDAKGIRIRGNPGGTNNFFSVGELRALAGDPNPSQPKCRTATLTVTDDFGQSSVAQVTISPGNTPPQVTITSPANNSLFSDWYPRQVPLTATVTDAEHPPAQLSYSWQILLHHTNHIHPEPPILTPAATATVDGHEPDCHTYFYEFKLTVTDAHCLSTTKSVFMYPNCCRADTNNDGFVDAIDYDQFIAAWLNLAPQGDYNADQFVDAIDYDMFISNWLSGC